LLFFDKYYDVSYDIIYIVSLGLSICRATKFIFALGSEISAADPELTLARLALIPEVPASNLIWILTV
jgi:hypothetical protein